MATGVENRQTILVVEDERPILTVVQKKLELSGFDVATARSVDQALAYLEDLERVDAVWLDHYLFGEGTGIDFVARVKQPNSAWKDVPIFVVSNTASEEKAQKYRELGVTKFYTKAETRLDRIVEDIQERFRTAR